MIERLRAIWLLLSFMLVVGCASTALPPIGAGSPAFQRETDEERLWESSKRFEALLAENRLLSQDAQLDAYLSKVAASLLPSEVSATGVTVRVRVVRNLIPNAFVLPNGTVYLHSRMLALMENEAQLSAIIGHELVHFINRHLVKERRDARNKAEIAKLVNTVLAEASYGLLAPLTGQLAEIWSLAAVRGYSRELETEADTLGFALVVRAGYDSAEVPKIFEALKRDLPPGRDEGFFFATHPQLQARIDRTRALLKEQLASKPPASRRLGRDEFERAISGLLLENAYMELRANRSEEARRSIDRHLAGNPGSPRGHFMRGEWWRLRGNAEEEALQSYETAIRLDARFPEPYREMGLLHRKRQETEPARAALQRYLGLVPKAPDAPIIRGYLNALAPRP